MDLLHCLYIFKLIAWLWKQKSKTQWKWNTFKMSEQTDFGYFCLNCYFKILHYLSRVFNESHGYSSWVVMLLMLLLSLSKCSLVLVPTSVSMETETDCCLQEGRGTLTRRRLWFRCVNLIDLTIYVNCVPTFENSASHWSHKNPHSLFYPFLFFFPFESLLYAVPEVAFILQLSISHYNHYVHLFHSVSKRRKCSIIYCYRYGWHIVSIYMFMW